MSAGAGDGTGPGTGAGAGQLAQPGGSFAGEVVGVLLAGGSSRRFGSDKLLQLLPDGTPVAVAAARKLTAVCARTVSVLRPEQRALHELLRAAGVEVSVDSSVAAGIGASLACAVRATPAAGGWLVLLADMPFLKPGSIAAVAGALAAGAGIVAASYAGRRGHPVGFASPWFGELAALAGDRGARAILESNPVTLIELDDPGVHRDIDTPADLPGAAC